MFEEEINNKLRLSEKIRGELGMVEYSSEEDLLEMGVEELHEKQKIVKRIKEEIASAKLMEDDRSHLMNRVRLIETKLNSIKRWGKSNRAWVSVFNSILSIDNKLVHIAEDLYEGKPIKELENDILLLSKEADEYIPLVKDKNDAWSRLIYSKLICIKYLMYLINNLISIVPSTDLEEVIRSVEKIHKELEKLERDGPFYEFNDKVGLEVTSNIIHFSKSILALLEDLKKSEPSARMTKVTNFIQAERKRVEKIVMNIDGKISEESIRYKEIETYESPSVTGREKEKPKSKIEMKRLFLVIIYTIACMIIDSLLLPILGLTIIPIIGSEIAIILGLPRLLEWLKGR
jgi:hypothetical protein